MMFRNLFYLSSLVLIALFTGCNEDPFNNSDINGQGDPQYISIIASIDVDNTLKSGYSDTRVAFKQDDLNIKLVWKADDKLDLCFVQDGKSYRGTAVATNISSTGRSAEFTITLPDGIGNGAFNLYGVHGGKGLSEDDPTIALLPDNSGIGSFNTLEESEDLMLYFSVKNFDRNKDAINVNLEHLGSLFSVSVFNSSGSAFSEVRSIDLVSTTNSKGWAYNNGNGGGKFDLVKGEFLNTNDAGDSFSFKTNGIGNGEVVTIWAWYPILPNTTWPEISIELKDGTGKALAKTNNSKPVRNIELGKAYYMTVTWDGSQLNFSDPVTSNIYFVKPDGDDNNNGKSWSTAFKTITKAVFAADDGGEVRVASGLYKEADYISFEQKGLTLKGGYNPATDEQDYSEKAKSIMDGNNTHRLLHINPSTGNANKPRIIDNFVFINGTGGGSGGVLYHGRAKETVISNSIFRNNTSSDASGGGTGDGGAINNNTAGVITIVNCLFAGNTTSAGGGAVANWNTCTAYIINCTFVNNSASRTGGAIYNRGTDSNPGVVHLYNSILWDNTAVIKGNELSSNYSTSILGVFNLNNNIIKGGASGIDVGTKPVNYINSPEIDAANIDPLFISDIDFQLSTGSPAINAGTNNLFLEGIDIDLEGKQRFNGKIDLGAYEVQ